MQNEESFRDFLCEALLSFISVLNFVLFYEQYVNVKNEYFAH